MLAFPAVELAARRAARADTASVDGSDSGVHEHGVSCHAGGGERGGGEGGGKGGGGGGGGGGEARPTPTDGQHPELHCGVLLDAEAAVLLVFVILGAESVPLVALADATTRSWFWNRYL